VARGFAAEADMLRLIAAAVQDLAGKGAVAMFEVQSAAGIPDVVATVFDREVLEERAAAGFVTARAGVAALLALSDAREARESLDARQVAAAAGLTPSYIRAQVLPGLDARGLAMMTAPGRWTAADRYRSPARRLVTVEAKLRDWRRGLGQAARHAAGADAAWLVLDGTRTRAAVSSADWFRAAGVGLAGLGRDGTLETLLEPDAAGVLRLRARRELLAERLAELYCSGAVSGPVGKVFGREPTCSTGSDPRYSGARERCAPVSCLPSANRAADPTRPVAGIARGAQVSGLFARRVPAQADAAGLLATDWTSPGLPGYQLRRAAGRQAGQ
jgi:hypothetical protein